MIAELLQGASQGGVIPPVPDSAPSHSQKDYQAAGEDCSPLMVEALDKLQNMGIPFVGDIVNLLMKGGGSQQSWQTLLKTIDSYGKHKNSVAADNVGNKQEMPNPQPPGSYQF